MVMQLVFVMAILETWVLYQLMGTLMVLKKSKTIKFFIYTGLYTTCLMPLQGGDVQNAYFIFLIYMAIGIASSREVMSKRIGSTCLFYAMTLAIKMVAIRIEWVLPLSGSDIHMSNVIEIIISTVVFYVVYRYFGQILGVTKEMISSRIWIFLTMIALAVVGMVIMSMVVVSYQSSFGANIAVILLMSACLMSILAIFFIIEEIAKGTREAAYRKKLEWELEYYNDLKVSQDETRKLLHDMKNHIGAVHAMLYSEQVQEATSYLKQVSGELHEQGSNVYCGHYVANALLNNKVKKMKEHQIAYQIEADLPQKLGITPMEVGSILANTIDNAIEACMKIEDADKRNIRIKMRYVHDKCIYEITNTKINEIVKKNQRFMTSKKDKTKHGYGMRQIHEIVNRYKGIINVEYDEDWFSVMIIM